MLSKNRKSDFYRHFLERFTLLCVITAYTSSRETVKACHWIGTIGFLVEIFTIIMQCCVPLHWISL